MQLYISLALISIILSSINLLFLKFNNSVIIVIAAINKGTKFLLTKNLCRMKKKYLSVALVMALASSMMFTSCIGSFSLTNKLLDWNKSVSSKFVNEIVFVAFWILKTIFRSIHRSQYRQEICAVIIDFKNLTSKSRHLF